MLYGGSRLMRKGQQVTNKPNVRSNDLSSDMPDRIVFSLMKEMDELYKDASEDPSLVIRASKKYPDVALVRGTNDGDDVATDVKRFMNIADQNWDSQIKSVKDFLIDNPEIRHVVGHSLGGAVAAEGVVGSNARTVGMDAARVLNHPDRRHVRNINTDSMFDQHLDPYGPAEKDYPTLTYFNWNKGAGERVGHRAENFKYRRAFKKNGPGKQTGYIDGKIRFHD